MNVPVHAAEHEQSRTIEREDGKLVEREYEDGRLFVRGIKSGKYSLREERERQRTAPRVNRSRMSPWHGGPQMWSKNLLNPDMGLMETLQASFEELAPGGKSQKHGHQNPALLYVLEGKGYDISDGERVDWQAGDMVIVARGTVHQHFNADPDHPARVLIIKCKPLYNFANLNYQEFIEKAPKTARPGWEDFHPED